MIQIFLWMWCKSKIPACHLKLDHHIGGEVVFLSVSKMDVQHFRLEIWVRTYFKPLYLGLVPELLHYSPSFGHIPTGCIGINRWAIFLLCLPIQWAFSLPSLNADTFPSSSSANAHDRWVTGVRCRVDKAPRCRPPARRPPWHVDGRADTIRGLWLVGRAESQREKPVRSPPVVTVAPTHQPVHTAAPRASILSPFRNPALIKKKKERKKSGKKKKKTGSRYGCYHLSDHIRGARGLEL